ncbi:MAG: helix-hairpin-helix domain-containing protein [Gemmatimonadaceae bacterium]|nr:helix-hairpin-helix domain-containing protein [Gemmatimonadaceae bacterium]
MATPAERKALLFFGIVIALGTGVRAAHIHTAARGSPDASARAALEVQLAAADSARHAKLSKKKGRKPPIHQKLPSARVDLDVAGEPEIEALRGIGPSLARRIVADRDSFGAFGSLEGLKRVRGIGSGLVAKLDSTVTFSLLPRPMNTVVSPTRLRPKKHVRDTLR